MKNTIIFLSGFVIGVLASAIGLKGYLKKKADEYADKRIDDEKDAMRAYYANKYGESVGGSTPLKVDETPKAEKTTPIIFKESDYEAAADEMNPYRYAKMYGNNYENKLEEIMAEREHPGESVVFKEPYVIDEKEFYEGCPDYASVTLTYYISDRTLADEDDSSIVDDIVGAIGDVGLEELSRYDDADISKLPDTLPVVYIRNDKIAVDYEVLFSTGSYSSEVLGN
jgi:hypothetical protein